MRLSWTSGRQATYLRESARRPTGGQKGERIHRSPAGGVLAGQLRGGFATKCYTCYIIIMDRTITQRELRNESAAVLREVQAGETMIVTRNGMPVAELRPIHPHRFVPRAAIAEAGKRAPRIDAGRFRADLDAVVDPSLDG